MEPDDKIIQEIIDLVTKQPFAPSKVLQKNPKYKHLNDYIMAWTAHMPDILYCARIYYAIHKKKDYVKCAMDMHRRISFDIDRRLWPKTVLNGLTISSMHTANPQKKYCVRNPKGILVDSLSYENKNALHYALYDSGKFVVECS